MQEGAQIPYYLETLINFTVDHMQMQAWRDGRRQLGWGRKVEYRGEMGQITRHMNNRESSNVRRKREVIKVTCKSKCLGKGRESTRERVIVYVRKNILYRSQSGMSMKILKEAFCLMDIEILCTDFHDFWTKPVGLVSKNVFWTNPPPWWRHNRPM